MRGRCRVHDCFAVEGWLNNDNASWMLMDFTVAILAQGTTHGPMRSRRPFCAVRFLGRLGPSVLLECPKTVATDVNETHDIVLLAFFLVLGMA